MMVCVNEGPLTDQELMMIVTMLEQWAKISIGGNVITR